MNHPTHQPCPVCGDAHRQSWHERNRWCYWLCSQCGHASLDPVPSDQDLSAFYEESYFKASGTGGYEDYLRDEPLHRLNGHDRLAFLKQAGAQGGRLLDIGCAAGFFLDLAQHAQPAYQGVGVDCSAWARNHAREKFGLTSYATLTELKSHEFQPFQAATLFQVLEHLPNPEAELGLVYETLAPNGALVIETWNRESWIARLFGGKWQQITPPSVIHLFSNRSLQRLVESIGFRNVRIQRSGKKVSAGFVGNLLWKKHPILMAPVGWVCSWPGVRSISARYALGDLVTLTAIK